MSETDASSEVSWGVPDDNVTTAKATRLKTDFGKNEEGDIQKSSQFNLTKPNYVNKSYNSFTDKDKYESKRNAYLNKFNSKDFKEPEPQRMEYCTINLLNTMN